MPKIIKFNGLDVTSRFATPYTVTYRKIRGPNAGYMMDGSYVDDVRAIKAELALQGQPISQYQMSDIVRALNKDTVEVYYFDERTVFYKTSIFRGQDLIVQYCGTKPDGLTDVWTCGNLTLTEV